MENTSLCQGVTSRSNYLSALEALNTGQTAVAPTIVLMREFVADGL
jgi:hypothetical protein